MTPRIDRFIDALGRYLPATIAWPIALLVVAGLRIALGRDAFAEWLMHE